MRSPRLSAFITKLERGHLLQRARQRLLRETQSLITRFILGACTPQDGLVVIATMNPDEENASVTAVLLAVGLDPLSPLDKEGSVGLLPGPAPQAIVMLSPDPASTRLAVTAAAKRLAFETPPAVQFVRLSYWSLLRAYRDATETYSTHVLLPGVDPAGKRKHVHLTHGSGPKPDTTFRGPSNVLASITPWWVESQLQEYKLPSGTETVTAMPRLTVMKEAIGDASVAKRLGFDPERRLAVWAPTYRAVLRGSEKRVSGVPLHDQCSEQFGPSELARALVERGWQFVAKVHPHDAESFDGFAFPVLTNSLLRECSVTPYELFGASDLLITDYSSLLTERAALRLPFALFCPDLKEFAGSYRSFRQPLFTDLYGDALVKTSDELDQLLDKFESRSSAHKTG